MFQGWDSFFLLLGPAAAGLIGLLFVVVTLATGREHSEVSRGQTLYLTPTALHFGVVLAVSAVALAPRLGTLATVGAISLAVLVGLAHAIQSCVGIRASKSDPHWSDFWCYGMAPAVVYIGLSAAMVALALHAAWAAGAMAALLLVLLLINIRNAWDLVTWIAPRRSSAGQ